MHTEQRTQAIDVIVVHVNVGGETAGGAASLFKYLQGIGAGYHKINDDKQLITAAADDLVVWGAGGVNQRALHICLVGMPDQTAGQWADPYSQAEIKIAAAAVANWCTAHRIPARKLVGQQVKDGMKGVCGHKDVSDAYPESQGHWDPGPNFPWTNFMSQVTKLVTPNVDPKPSGKSEEGQVFWLPGQKNDNFRPVGVQVVDRVIYLYNVTRNPFKEGKISPALGGNAHKLALPLAPDEVVLGATDRRPDGTWCPPSQPIEIVTNLASAPDNRGQPRHVLNRVT